MNQNRTGRRIIGMLLAALAVLLLCAAGAEEAREPLDYSDPANWVYLGAENGETRADVFFIAPSAFGGKEGAYLLDLANEKGRNNFTGVINMEKGIYDDTARFYAPFYRQMGYNASTLPEEETEALKAQAYADVRDAFVYYMEHLNGGRPLVLAGFSQGADMAIRLLKDCFAGEGMQEQLIACYAIGWHLTEEETAEWPWVRPARGETDTGVVICFNSEAEELETSFLLPAGMKTQAINPLNWRTDGEPAGKDMNLGACFTDYAGEITSEVPQLTGAYLEAERGALKVTDIDPEAYPQMLPILESGEYHVYDYQFFYRNLEKNVQDRIGEYMEGR